MKNPPEIAERIKKIRAKRGETQKQFARQLEVSQATVSAWEKGHDIPSPLHCIGLAMLTFPSEDANWFAAQAGPKTHTLFTNARTALKVRRARPREGEIIRVPWEIKSARATTRSGRLLALPAEFVISSGSTRCLTIHQTLATSMLLEGDVVILDTSENSSPDLRPFWDQIVLIEIDLSAGRTLDPDFTWGPWLERLCMGKLRQKMIKRPEIPKETLDWYHKSGFQLWPEIPFWVATVAPFDDSETIWEPGSLGTYVGHWTFRPPESPLASFEEFTAWNARMRKESLTRIKLEEACSLLGRVIGWFRPIKATPKE